MGEEEKRRKVFKTENQLWDNMSAWKRSNYHILTLIRFKKIRAANFLTLWVAICTWKFELDTQDYVDRWISTCLGLCFISLLLPRERQIYDLTIALWADDCWNILLGRRLLESLNCRRKEKATISNTDGLPQFTAGLDDWKGRIIY